MSNQTPRKVIPIKLEPPSSLSPAERSAVLDACARLKSLPGALLPILHALQERFGYVDARAVGMIAKTLNFSRAEVSLPVISFSGTPLARIARHL